MRRGITRRQMMQGSIAAAIGASTLAHTGCRREASARNLLIVTVEDWRADAASCYGSALAKTPHFDDFAASGVRFDRAYCQSSICGPSRASLLTGLRPDATAVLKNPDPFDELVPASVLTLPEYVRNAGFTTINIGKLFHGVSSRLHAYDRLELWDRPVGFAGRSDTGRPVGEVSGDESDTAEQRSGARRDEYARYGASGEAAAESPDGLRARMAAEILRERSRDGQPFMLSLGFQKPHLPFLAPEEYVALYDPKEMPAPPADPSQDVGVPDAATRWGVNYGPFAGARANPRFAGGVIAAYLACVSFMDAQLGLVLDALDETGLAENTVVIVLADHGFHLGEHGIWGKETLFEQATRVPLVVRDPGAHANGGVCSRLVELVDVVPTVLDLVGAGDRSELDGRSLAPLLRDTEEEWHPASYSVCARSRDIIGRSVRTDRHRWSIWSRLDGGFDFELYDLETDPWETRNVAQDPAYAEVAKAHARLFREHQQRATAGS